MSYFYRNSSEETCIPYVSKLFETLQKNERVEASLHDSGVQGGISLESITAIHNHLQSSRIWKKVTPWNTEVEYIIPHPDGDISAFDTSSGGDAKLTRNDIRVDFTASCVKKTNTYVSFKRIVEEPSDKMDFNTTRFSSVKIMNTKRFYYETERSSWVFRLVVMWSGSTKQEAEESDKTYIVSIETNDVRKAYSNPKYISASFLEKILDIISLDGRRKILTFQTPGLI